MSDEQNLFRGSSSPVINLGTFVLCAMVLVAALIFSFVGTLPPLVNVLLWIVAGIALIYIVVQWLLIKFRVYEVTSERLRVTTGILTKRTDELELYRVKDATLIQPFFARIFGLGSIEVTSVDASTPTIMLEYIRGARELREQMRKAIETCRDRKRVRVAELE